MVTQSVSPSVLIVDDTADNITVLIKILDQAGYRIRPALSGQIALKAIQAEAPSLILMDIMMPEMNGYALCQQIKSNPQTADIPIIFLSALSETTDKVKALRCGGADFITKPFQSEEVLARVETHLHLYQARQDLAAQNQTLLETVRLREDVDSIMRHDLVSPLSGIINLVKIMRANPNGKKIPAYLKTVETASYRILNQINRSLDLLKMERQSYPFSPQPVDLLKVVRECLRDQRHLQKTKQLTVELIPQQLPTPLPCQVLGDELLCFSMLSNLIKNALEASPDQGQVTITLQETTTGQKSLSIHNQGAIPAQIRDKLFQKYITAGKKNGTGLGVYSASLMAKTQQGHLSLQSDEESGTTFTITLPRAIAARSDSTHEC